MRFANKIKPLILLIIFSLGFITPFYISQGAGAIAYITKEFGLDLVARAIARKLLTDLGNGVVERINNLGIDRGQPAPAFIQDWKRYLGDAQTIGENQFRAQLTYSISKGLLCSNLKDPLSKAFQVNTKNAPYVDVGAPAKNAQLKQNTTVPYQSKVKCTVPDKTREEFSKDFEKGGGWDTWSRMLEPQNNLAGALSLSLEELATQRSSQEEAQKNEAVAGQGFQGVKSACQQAANTTTGVQDTVCYKNCLPKGTAAGTVIQSCLDQCKGQTAIGANAQCTFLGQTVTPAKILGEGAANFLDSNAKFLVTSDELSEVLVSMVGAVVNKVTDFTSKGLSDLTGGLLGQDVPNFLPAAQKDEQIIEETAKKSNGDYCDTSDECKSKNCNIDSRVSIYNKVCTP